MDTHSKEPSGNNRLTIIGPHIANATASILFGDVQPRYDYISALDTFIESYILTENLVINESMTYPLEPQVKENLTKAFPGIKFSFNDGLRYGEHIDFPPFGTPSREDLLLLFKDFPYHKWRESFVRAEEREYFDRRPEKINELIFLFVKYEAPTVSLPVLYRPDPQELPFYLYLNGKMRRIQIDLVLEIFKQAEGKFDQLRSEINQTLGQKIFTTPMPFFLRVVLNECKRRSDIPIVVRQIRDTRGAKKYRIFFDDLSVKFFNGELNEFQVKEILDEIAKMTALDVGSENDAVYDLITSLPLSGITVESVLNLTSLLLKDFSFFRHILARRHYSFAKKIIEKYKKAKTLNSQLRSVLGIELSDDEKRLFQNLLTLTPSDLIQE